MVIVKYVAMTMSFIVLEKESNSFFLRSEDLRWDILKME